MKYCCNCKWLFRDHYCKVVWKDHYLRPDNMIQLVYPELEEYTTTISGDELFVYYKVVDTHKLNLKGDCKFYERKWWKFWINPKERR